MNISSLNPAAVLSKMRRAFHPLSTLHRFRSCQRGAPAVEFVLVAPVLIILLTGIVQLGLMFFVQHSMVSVSQETVRLVAVGELTTAEGETYANDHLISWGMTYDISVQQQGSDIVVDIAVPFSDVALIDYLGLFQSGDMTARTSMRGS